MQHINICIEVGIGGCKGVSGGACEIPFTYNGNYYDTCINIDNGGKLWCYTNILNETWEDCDVSTCLIESGGYKLLIILPYIIHISSFLFLDDYLHIALLLTDEQNTEKHTSFVLSTIMRKLRELFENSDLKGE